MQEMMRKRLSTLLRSAVIGGTLVLLSGCGSRAGELDEKIARAEQAAQKAEAAQKAAELAAQKAVAFSKTSSMTQDTPSEAERDMDKASQDPNSAYFDNTIATPEG